jgi:hypothetical protein
MPEILTGAGMVAPMIPGGQAVSPFLLAGGQLARGSTLGWCRRRLQYLELVLNCLAKQFQTVKRLLLIYLERKLLVKMLLKL